MIKNNFFIVFLQALIISAIFSGCKTIKINGCIKPFLTIKQCSINYLTGFCYSICNDELRITLFDAAKDSVSNKVIFSEKLSQEEKQKISDIINDTSFISLDEKYYFVGLGGVYLHKIEINRNNVIQKIEIMDLYNQKIVVLFDLINTLIDKKKYKLRTTYLIKE